MRELLLCLKGPICVLFGHKLLKNNLQDSQNTLGEFLKTIEYFNLNKIFMTLDKDDLCILTTNEHMFIVVIRIYWGLSSKVVCPKCNGMLVLGSQSLSTWLGPSLIQSVDEKIRNADVLCL